MKSEAELRSEVEEQWAYWRFVLSGGRFDYNTYDAVFNHMLPSEINAANIALDLQIEAEKKAAESITKKK